MNCLDLPSLQLLQPIFTFNLREKERKTERETYRDRQTERLRETVRQWDWDTDIHREGGGGRRRDIILYIHRAGYYQCIIKQQKCPAWHQQTIAACCKIINCILSSDPSASLKVKTACVNVIHSLSMTEWVSVFTECWPQQLLPSSQIPSWVIHYFIIITKELLYWGTGTIKVVYVLLLSTTTSLLVLLLLIVLIYY